MDTIPSYVLFIVLIVLILLSAFFSSSETGMMSLNRYRLKHKAKFNNTAKRVHKLIEKPDRLLGVILIGNTFANILCGQIASIWADEHLGQVGMMLTPIVLTFVVLIFGEMMPKTLAALYPEKFAFGVSLPLKFLLKLLYPLVFVSTLISNSFIKMMGIKVNLIKQDYLNREELITLVNETSTKLSNKDRAMLLAILSLEEIVVEDIMVPKFEIMGIDLNNDWDSIMGQLSNSQHSFLPVYREHIDNVMGIIHLKRIIHLISNQSLVEASLIAALEEPYCVPEGTPLHTQLINFQHNKRRTALVVNEYGDIQGLVALEDILEEIVGEYTTDMASTSADIHPQDDGTYIIDGTINIRHLNRKLHLKLPTDGPRTLSGLVIDYLETIPNVGTCLKIANTPMEVIYVSDNLVKTIRINPKWQPAEKLQI